MKILKRTIIATIIAAVFLSFFYFFWLSPKYVVPILMYHRFGYNESTLFVAPENFRRQMTYLRKRDYNVISLDRLVKGIRAGKTFKHNTVVITIDDGYKDNFTYAYPILEEYNFPATIFLVANHIGNSVDFINWEEVCAMCDDNISFGGHTKNHAYLPSIDTTKVLWEEIGGCKGFVENKIGKQVDYFCYPMGAFSEQVKTMVKKAGYKGACTTNRGLAKLNQDVYELKRIKVTKICFLNTLTLLEYLIPIRRFYETNLN